MADEMNTKSFRCPCCGFKTLYGRGQDDICQVCYWQDDGQDDRDAHHERGGPNEVSLAQARLNFSQFGASTERLRKFARPARADEM